MYIPAMISMNLQSSFQDLSVERESNVRDLSKMRV